MTSTVLSSTSTYHRPTTSQRWLPFTAIPAALTCLLSGSRAIASEAMIERSVSFADDVHYLWRTVACGGDNPIVGDQPEKAIAGFSHRSAPFGLDVASADGVEYSFTCDPQNAASQVNSSRAHALARFVF